MRRLCFLVVVLAVLLGISFAQSPRYEVMLNRPDIVGLTGGGNTKLDGIATTGLAVGTIVLVYDESSGETRIYRLSDTTGVVNDSIPIVIVPDDYNATTNHKVWKLSISSDPDETGASDTISPGSGDSTDTIVVMAQMKVFGELIADSIQSAGDTLYIDKPFHSVGFNNVGTATITGLATVNGGIHITAGGIDIDLGGINVDDGGLNVNAGGANITGAVNVTGSETISNALYVDTIDVQDYDTVIINDDLKVVGELVADSIQAVGNVISIKDSIDVNGTVTADSVNVTNGVAIGGDLNVTGDFSANEGTFNGNLTANSGNITTDLTVGDDLSADSIHASDDVVVSNNLDVSGTGHFGGDVTVDGALTVGGLINVDTLYIEVIENNSGDTVYVNDYLSVVRELVVDSIQSETGLVEVDDSLLVHGSLRADSAYINNGAYVGGDLGVGGELSVIGDISGDNGDFTGNLDVGGYLDVADYVSADSIYAGDDVVVHTNLVVDTIKGDDHDTVVVLNDFKVHGELIADSIQAVGNVISIKDSIDVEGTVTADSINVANGVAIGGDLGVSGDFSANEGTFNGNLTANSGNITTDLTVGDDLSADSIHASDDVVVSNNLDVSGTGHFGGDVTVEGDLTVNGNLVNGNIGIDTLYSGDKATVTDTIVAYDNFKVYGELIADSIQAVGNTILVTDNILVSGGNRYYGTDATGADSFWVYDDGDTTRFDSDNPIKIGHSSIVVDTTGYVTISDGLIVGDDTVIVSGGDMSTSGLKAENIIYVAKNGDDTHGDGSLLKPFATIGAAINKVISNDDNSMSKPYTIKIFPGVYTEDVTLNSDKLVNLHIEGTHTYIGLDVEINGDFTCTSNNDNFSLLTVTGVRITGDIDIEGAKELTMVLMRSRMTLTSRIV